MTEETLFELARKTRETERSGLLDRACEGNPELRVHVEALLKADDRSLPLSKPSPMLDATTGFQGTANYSSPEPSPGILIAGRYTLEQKIGEGGMGEVWVAKQSEPVKRKVELKLIKAGMDSKSVVSIPADQAIVKPWSPNQLRHNRATELRRHGLDLVKTHYSILTARTALLRNVAKMVRE